MIVPIINTEYCDLDDQSNQVGFVDSNKNDSKRICTTTKTNNSTNPSTLRRHQSRFRSLKRRQMENLARRAQWFLNPISMPQINLTPNNLPLESQFLKDLNITATSTVSLLDIDNYHQNQLDSNQHYYLHSTHPYYSFNPCILLCTSSTTDLNRNHQLLAENNLNLTNHNFDLYGDVVNKSHFLSIQSPVFANSFSSLHSAPTQSQNQYEPALSTAQFYPQVLNPTKNSNIDPILIELDQNSSIYFRPNLTKLSALNRTDFYCSNVVDPSAHCPDIPTVTNINDPNLGILSSIVNSAYNEVFSIVPTQNDPNSQNDIRRSSASVVLECLNYQKNNENTK